MSIFWDVHESEISGNEQDARVNRCYPIGDAKVYEFFYDRNQTKYSQAL